MPSKPVKTTAVATIGQSADGVSSSLVLDVLSGRVDAKKMVWTAPDPEAMAQRIAERDINASSLAELLGGSESISGKDYANKPFALLSVDWNESDQVTNAVPFYAVLHGATPQGEQVTITCGSTSVMRKAAVMDANGWLPAWVKIIKGKVNANGNQPLDLVAAPEAEPFD